MSLQNYRVTFGGIEIDYKSDFEKCREYMPHIDAILDILTSNGVEEDEHWFFFEPYVEITWLDWKSDRADTILQCIKDYLSQYPELTNVKFMTPENGDFADWYFMPGNYQERGFGYRRYALCARQAELFYDYMDEINGENSKGLEDHYIRSCHVLANQLGLNYYKEGKLMFWRAILCFLFMWFGHHKAVWIYTKVLRRKY